MRERLFNRFVVMAVAAAIVLCGVCLPAHAGEAYLGASYLSSSGDFSSSGETFSPNADGWKVFGGWDFNKFFGAELTYYDLGNLDETQGTQTFSADVKVYDLAFRGILPLGERFDLFARLGYSNVSVDSTLAGTSASASASATDWKLLYGLGADLKLGKSFGLRAEWEAWDVEGALQVYSLGAYYRFGKR
jgi:OmpA-OmpF porin, OOP family